jgi:hypothetical protein
MLCKKWGEEGLLQMRGAPGAGGCLAERWASHVPKRNCPHPSPRKSNGSQGPGVTVGLYFEGCIAGVQGRSAGQECPLLTND